MIRRRVSAALQLRDSFRGCPAEGKAICTLNGRQSRPQARPGGWLIWTDLPAGAYDLTVSLHGYQTGVLTIEVPEKRLWEGSMLLAPGIGYRFQHTAAKLTLRLVHGKKPIADAEIWLCTAGRAELRIAQDTAAKGAEALRLYCKGNRALLPVPGTFLVMDEDKPELIRLAALEEEGGILAAPLKAAHGRGKVLMQAQPAYTSPDGLVQAAFAAAGNLAVLYGKKVQQIPLEAGEHEIILKF